MRLQKNLGYNCAKIELAIDNDNKIGVLNYYFSDSFIAPHTDIAAYLNKNTKERNNYYTISNIKTVLDDIDPRFEYLLIIMNLFQPLLQIKLNLM